MTSSGTPLDKLSPCVYSHHVHLVLVTKPRRRAVTVTSSFPSANGGACRRRSGTGSGALIAETAGKWECELLEYNGESDHVHMLLMLNPKVQPSKFVNNLKPRNAPRRRPCVVSLGCHIPQTLERTRRPSRPLFLGRHAHALVPLILHRQRRRRAPDRHQGLHRKPRRRRIGVG